MNISHHMKMNAFDTNKKELRHEHLIDLSQCEQAQESEHEHTPIDLQADDDNKPDVNSDV